MARLRGLGTSGGMFVKNSKIGGFAAAKGKRKKNKGLIDVLGKTKANIDVAVAGDVPAPVRRAQELRKVVPRALKGWLV